MNLRKIMAAAGVLAIAAVSVFVYRHLHRSTPAKAVPVVAIVQVAPLETRTISREVTAYGTVSGAPGDQWKISRPFETEIIDVYVAAGQRIRKGQPLLKVGPGPAAVVEIARARSAARLAGDELRQVRRRYAIRLATNSDVLAARRAYDNAAIRWRALRKYSGVPTVIRAPAAGYVGALPFPAPGAIAAKGRALVTVVSNRRLQCTLGVEPGVATQLAIGAPVAVAPLSSGARFVPGTVAAVAGSVNPKTRLVDVFVQLPPSGQFLTGQYVQGTLTVRTMKGFVVAHSAVLPEGANRVLYTVMNGRAVRHEVHIGLRNHASYEISAPDLHDGDHVVVLGNYELRPGMRVREQAAP